MTFICELTPITAMQKKKERDGGRSHNNNIKMELKGKNILNKTVENSDKIHYKKDNSNKFHEDKYSKNIRNNLT